jgi:hypothetical protein
LWQRYGFGGKRFNDHQYDDHRKNNYHSDKAANEKRFIQLLFGWDSAILRRALEPITQVGLHLDRRAATQAETVTFF